MALEKKHSKDWCFYNEFHKERMRCGLKYRLILTEDAKKLGEKRKKQDAEVKYMNLKNEIQWGIIGNAFFMYYATGKVPASFLIIDEKFAKSFEFTFDTLWSLDEKQRLKNLKLKSQMVDLIKLAKDL